MNRPRVKPEHAPYRIGGGKIRIGGVSFGIAAEIEDPDGWVWTMLSAMDGSRSPDEVVAHVAEMHPGQSGEQLRAAAQQLIRSGYVEDAFASTPAGLTPRDIQRHTRSLGFYRWLDLTPRGSSWEPQSLISQAKVTVLGVGGTGGVAAMALAASGIGHLHCVDPDLVELSNLNRQVLYTEGDIGHAKADAAVARLQNLNSDISTTGERSRVNCVDDVVRLADDCDILILAADQPISRSAVGNTNVDQSRMLATEAFLDRCLLSWTPRTGWCFRAGEWPMLGMHKAGTPRPAC